MWHFLRKTCPYPRGGDVLSAFPIVLTIDHPNPSPTQKLRDAHCPAGDYKLGVCSETSLHILEAHTLFFNLPGVIEHRAYCWFCTCRVGARAGRKVEDGVSSRRKSQLQDVEMRVHCLSQGGNHRAVCMCVCVCLNGCCLFECGICQGSVKMTDVSLL